MKITVPLYLIVLCLAIIVLQNAGLISALKQPRIIVSKVDVPIDVARIQRTVDMNVAETINVNLAEIVGRELVETQSGMSIGVSSKEGTVIPINWGEVTITR